MSSRLCLSALIVAAFLYGCGGGGASDPPQPPGGDSGGSTGGEQRSGTALFNVDVASGKVNITNLTPQTRSVFSGGSVTFLSSTLVDTPGNTGRRVMRVSLKNNLTEEIGGDGGLRLTFGDFTNINGGIDLRTKTTVSTHMTFAGGSGASPLGIALAPNGGYYVATLARKIFVVRNGQATVLAGSGNSWITDGAGQAASFAYPRAIAVDGQGNLAVCDQNTIRRVTPQGLVTTIAGAQAAGESDGAGDVARFQLPSGIAVGSDGRIYVGDSGNHTIRVISAPVGDPRLATSYNVSTLAGNQGNSGFHDGVGMSAMFSGITSVALDTSETALYVTDHVNKRVRRVALTGEVNTVAGTGQSGFVDGTGDVAKFPGLGGIVSTGENSFVLSGGYFGADLRQIVLSPGTSPTVASNWRVSRIAGSDSGGKGTGDGVGTTARFDIPLDLVYDGNTISLVDYSTNTLRRIISTTGFPVPSNGGSSTTEKVVMANADGIVAGSQNSYLAYDEGIPAGASSPTRDWAFTIPDGVTAFQFTVTVEGGTETPAGLAAIKRASGGAGSPDNMVSTAAGSVTEAAYVNGALPSARFNTLFGVALDAQGNAFVSDILNNAIRRIGTDGIVSTVAGMPGNNLGYADGTGLTAEISYPGGLAVNDSGTLLYVADSYGNTIRRIALTGSDPAQPGDWTVTTIAGSAGEYGNSDGIGASARFFGPYAIAMGKGNVLYVSESAGRRIRRLDPVGSDLSLPTSWRITTLAGSTYGQSGYLDATGPAALFYEPLGIALDQAGNVLVCDQQRLRKVTPAGVVTTVAGSGGTGAVDAVGTAATFTDLTAVAVDSAGYIYVTGNDMRIRRISPQAAVTTVAGTGASGNTDGPGHTAKFQPYCGTMNFDTQGTLWRTVGNTLKKVQRIITKP